MPTAAVSPPRVGVVVPCKNEIGTLERCLGALRAQRPEVLHVVVVDNGSTDGSLDVARRCADRVLELPDATISQMRNRGAQALPDVDVVGFVDADCEVSPSWLRAGLEALETSVLVGARTQASPDAGWVARRWAAVEAATAHGDSKVWSQHLLVHRSTFDELGGFREDLTTGEDADLSDRVAASGGEVRLEPRMAAVHHGFPDDLASFLRRELWHTRASGWYARMSPNSRLLVVAAALAAGGAPAAALLSRGDRRVLAGIAAAGALAVPALGVLGGRSPRHAWQDGVLVGIWALVRAVRVPGEVARAGGRVRP